MLRKWTVGATGFALLATTFVVVACSSKSDDDDSSGGTSSGATGGTTPTAGKGGTGTGGSTGGTGGTLGGSGGTGGSTGGSTAGTGVVTGGSGGAAAGTAGTLGMSGAGGAGGPFACKGAAATCDTWSDFGTGTAAWWGSGDFNGGFSTFAGTGSMLTIDQAMLAGGVLPSIHITGTVAGYGVGFNFWFSYCSDLSAYTGIQFKLSGTTMYATTANAIDFQPQTNSDYPWQPRPQDMKGGCTSPTPDNPWGDCVAPTKHLTLSDTPTMVLWSDPDLANGKPAPFDAMSPKEIVGLQFQFPWAEGATAYAVDITLDDVSFIGGTGKSCGTMVSGGGGMGAGGASSGGAGAGGASSGGAGAGGVSAGGIGGIGGAAAGTAGATGGGMGGMSGGGGRGGRGGAGAGGAAP